MITLRLGVYKSCKGSLTLLTYCLLGLCHALFKSCLSPYFTLLSLTEAAIIKRNVKWGLKGCYPKKERSVGVYKAKHWMALINKWRIWLTWVWYLSFRKLYPQFKFACIEHCVAVHGPYIELSPACWYNVPQDYLTVTVILIGATTIDRKARR